MSTRELLEDQVPDDEAALVTVERSSPDAVSRAQATHMTADEDGRVRLRLRGALPAPRERASLVRRLTAAGPAALVLASVTACSADEQACFAERNRLLEAARSFGEVTAVAVLLCLIVIALQFRPERPASAARGLLAVVAAVGAAAPAALLGGLLAERTVDLPSCGLTEFEFGPVLGLALAAVPLIFTGGLTASLLWLAGKLWWSAGVSR